MKKNNSAKFLLLLGWLLLGLLRPAMAQRANPDALADRNAKLEVLLLEYKQQLVKADVTIERLNKENKTLTRQINQLMSKENKTRTDINQLVQERNQLLSNKIRLEATIKKRANTVKLLEETNKQLKRDNQRLQSNNDMLEEAAAIADTIQRYQGLTILRQEESMRSMMSNYAQKCSEVTGQYKSPLSRDVLNIVFDGTEKGPENRYIESLTVSACFQIPDEQASEKVIVYFTLYDRDSKKAVRRIRFPVPKTQINSNISYYEGTHRIETQGQLQLSDDIKYYYEITYLEHILAKGTISAS